MRAEPKPHTEIDESGFVCLATIQKSGTHFVRHFLINYLLRLAGMHPGGTLFSHKAYAFFPNQRTRYSLGTAPYQVPTQLPEHFGVRDIVVQHGFTWLDDFPGRIIALHRNPLDYVVSCYHYFHQSRADAALHVNGIADIAEKRAAQYARQYVDLQKLARKSPHNLLTYRYEELTRDPVPIFAQIVRFIGAPLDDALLRQTVADVSMDAFRSAAAEQKLNVGMAVPIARNGGVGQWKQEMTSGDVRIVADTLARYNLDLDAMIRECGINHL